MQMMSAAEKAALEAKREEMYKDKIDVQDRIRKAAALGDLSENASTTSPRRRTATWSAS